MIYLILGNKGSGKTKRLIDLVNAAVEKSNGNVVCIEKERLLTYNVNYVQGSLRPTTTASAATMRSTASSAA